MVHRGTTLLDGVGFWSCWPNIQLFLFRLTFWFLLSAHMLWSVVVGVRFSSGRRFDLGCRSERPRCRQVVARWMTPPGMSLWNWAIPSLGRFHFPPGVGSVLGGAKWRDTKITKSRKDIFIFPFFQEKKRKKKYSVPLFVQGPPPSYVAFVGREGGDVFYFFCFVSRLF